MTSIGQLIAKFDPSYLLVSRPNKFKIELSIILYVFKAQDERSMTQLLKDEMDWTGQQAIDFRKHLMFSGYVQKNLKFFLYACMLKDLIDETVYALQYQVDSNDDIQFARRICRSIHHPECKKLMSHCQKMYNGGKCPPRKLLDFDKGLVNVYTELRTFSRKFTLRKFAFVINSGVASAEDIINEQLLFGLYTAYRAYPQIQNTAHLQNIAKRAIHNRGINMIHEFTSRSRLRLSQHSDGVFTTNLMSISRSANPNAAAFMNSGMTFNQCGPLDCTLDGQSAEGLSLNQLEDKKDLQISISNIKDKTQDSKFKHFIHLMMGHYDPKFSDFIGEPNDDLAFESQEKQHLYYYGNKVLKYLDIPYEVARTYVQALRSELKAFA